MIDVRTGIRKTYRWRLGASRLSQASGRNPNRTDSETSALTERWFQSPRAIGIHSGPRPLRRGPCWVGDRRSGSPRPEAVLGTRHTRARPASADGTVEPGIRGPGPATPPVQRMKRPPASFRCAWESRATVRAPRCPQGEGAFREAVAARRAKLGKTGTGDWYTRERPTGTAGMGGRTTRAVPPGRRTCRRRGPPR
jgi:hypothetical protein